MSAGSPRPFFDAPEPVMRTASDWLSRRDRGFSPEEAAEFARWLGADPSHAAAVRQLERTLSRFDRLRDLGHTGEPPDPDVFAPVRRFDRRWLSLAGLGLAAAVALAFWLPREPAGPSAWSFATSAGGFERLTLVDGSAVELNAATSIRVEYSPRDRRVWLDRGEAHFQVAKDTARPFIVQAGSVSVRAVGTAFNVRVESTGVEVLVTSGKVRVEPPPSPAPSGGAAVPQPAPIPLLTAGQRVTVPTVEAKPATVSQVSVEEIRRALAWQNRVTEFSQTPLVAAVAKFNRHPGILIVIDDPELEQLRIGGTFRTDQPEAFVRLLETSFGVTADRKGDVIRLRRASAAR